MISIVCREYEQAELLDCLKSKTAEFIVIYGRRRIGKTFLVKEFFRKKRCVFFHVTGIKNGLLDEQLEEFSKTIGQVFYHGAEIATPKSWLKAFEALTKAIRTVKTSEKVVLFFDEFPWMATRRSRLIQALDYYWNRYWVDCQNIKLIICGSSASWIIKNIVDNKGGLHNRTTNRLILKPFTLPETKIFLDSRNIKLSNKQIVQLYIAMGGVPYYLKHVKKGYSAARNINNMIFNENGILFDEFDKLFSSLFNNSDIYIAIIKAIAKFTNGLSRAQLEAYPKLSFKGGRLTAYLKDLETAGFIRSFLPVGHNRIGVYYRVIDEYCYFYLKWVISEKQTLISLEKNHDYWMLKSKSPSYLSWAGYAFEILCYKHIDIIRKTLNILSDASVGSWRYMPRAEEKSRGAQIDLLFDNNDGSITICEVKYTDKAFIVDKLFNNDLSNKIEIYKRITRTDKQIFVVLISASGIKKTTYSDKLIDKVITLDDIFNNK